MSTPSVVIVDYGLGNLFNVQRALEFAGAAVEISPDPARVLQADRLVLPGVGAFAQGMEGLRARHLDEAVRGYAAKGRPFLGICLGMQLLMSQSEELGLHDGLDVVRGRVVRLSEEEAGGRRTKVPEIGWNELQLPAHRTTWKGTVLEDLPPRPSMYFLHSYHVVLEAKELCLAETEYGVTRFCSVFQKDNVIGIQPHPERSGRVAGIALLQRFITL